MKRDKNMDEKGRRGSKNGNEIEGNGRMKRDKDVKREEEEVRVKNDIGGNERIKRRE